MSYDPCEIEIGANKIANAALTAAAAQECDQNAPPKANTDSAVAAAITSEEMQASRPAARRNPLQEALEPVGQHAQKAWAELQEEKDKIEQECAKKRSELEEDWQKKAKEVQQGLDDEARKATEAAAEKAR